MYYSIIRTKDRHEYWVRTETPILNRRYAQFVLTEMGYHERMEGMTISPVIKCRYWWHKIMG